MSNQSNMSKISNIIRGQHVLNIEQFCYVGLKLFASGCNTKFSLFIMKRKGKEEFRIWRKAGNFKKTL